MRFLTISLLFYFVSLPSVFALTYGDMRVFQEDTQRRLLAAAEKIKERQSKLNLIQKDIPGSAPGDHDSAYDFLKTVHYETLEEIDRNKLTSARLVESPWSDHYWPIYAGILSYRYSDPHYPESYNWKVNADYLYNNLGQGGDLDLSPAEKYDYLVGDKNFTLTKAMLDQGKPYFDRYGKVESWMGICHGWAPASYSLKRPRKEIKVSTPEGRFITFYPSDIKGLASLLWANARVPARFIGGRCEEKDPPVDGRNRPIDQTCLDNNPATWHLVVVNQIGDIGRSFVMDKTFSYEVWNQPVYGYEYGYFNPKTKKDVNTLKEAKVKLSDFPNDPRRAVRAENARSVVGITMQVTYSVESMPEARPYDSEQFDSHRTDTYVYDLELDEHDRIIGGEWYSEEHPDFIWAPFENSRALSPGDEALSRSSEKWIQDQSIPRSWQSVAINSSRYSLPLALIVEELIRLSNLSPTR